MPPVDEWASDAEYPPATSVGVDQSTKVEPSTGAKAQGFLPGHKITAQRLNWILNELCVLANELEEDLETLGDALAARSLQAAYARSVALAQTAPHIDVGSSGFSIGGADDASILSVAGASGIVSAKTLSAGSASTLGALGAGGLFTASAGMQAAGGDISLGDVAQLLIDAATDTLTLKLGNLRLHGYGAGQRAVIHNGSGVASDLPLESGAYTPTVSAVTGTGVTAGDFTNIAGNFIRVGKTFHFSLDFQVNTTGWSGSGTVSFTLPVAGTVDGYVRGTVTAVESANFTTMTLARSASPTVLQVLMIRGGTSNSYVSVSGTLTLQ